MTGANLWWHNVLFLALVASKTPLGFGSFKRGQLTTSCLLSMPAVKENKGKGFITSYLRMSRGV
jgi:hypothetical protein